MIRLARPFRVQEFQSDKLRAKVIYAGSSQQAIWVDYTLPDSWTQEQINAALKTYDSNWKIVQENLGVSFMMGDKAPVAYGSSTGFLAYKTMMNELIVYSPQLCLDLLGQIQEEERQKKSVPKF
jgi:hypothetical protein